MVDIKKEFQTILQVQRLSDLEQDLQFTAQSLETSYTEIPGGLSEQGRLSGKSPTGHPARPLS